MLREPARKRTPWTVIMLDPRLQAEILRLYFSERLSVRKIAKQLKVHRVTVGDVVVRRQVRLDAQERDRRASILDPYYPRIQKLLDAAPERSCINIMQRLREAGYTGGVTILRDYLRLQRPRPAKEAFFELEFAKGEAAQVDWGEFGDVFGNGTKVHCFVMVLCWSRLLYLEFTLRETLSTLLRCFERALRFFGGRCQEYWFDNMPTVVAERMGRLKRFTTGFLAYTGFHGFTPILCNLNSGNEKGRVEDGVKLVRHQFWPDRSFIDPEDMNRQAVEWRDCYANRREHRTTHKIPELMFAQEREALLTLRPDPYDTDDVVSCPVSHNFLVPFESNRYSVPWTLVEKRVTLRAEDHRVRIFYGRKKVADHARCYLKGQTIRNPKHEEGLREIKPGASRQWQVEAVRSFGPQSSRYLEFIGAGTRSLRHEVGEFLFLATVYGKEAMEETIASLLDQGIVGVAHLERALRLREGTPAAPPPLSFPDERLRFVPPSPHLETYDTLLLDARREKIEEKEEK
jgi:transposase